MGQPPSKFINPQTRSYLDSKMKVNLESRSNQLEASFKAHDMALESAFKKIALHADQVDQLYILAAKLAVTNERLERDSYNANQAVKTLLQQFKAESARKFKWLDIFNWVGFAILLGEFVLWLLIK